MRRAAILLPLLALLVSTAAMGRRQAGCTPALRDTVTTLPLPERPADAPGGHEFAQRIARLSLRDREITIVQEILAGNVPSFCRTLRAVEVERNIGSRHYDLVFYVACDYVAVGSEEDYLYTPMTPSTAQYLADRLGCTLPTKRMVDVIYACASVKLRPQPISPSDQMTTVPVFLQHTDSIRSQFTRRGIGRTPTAIVAGHKKDIIISRKIYTLDRNYDRVVIYGWHRGIGDPIQPVYNGHHANYADYSHGVRLVASTAILNGDTVQVAEILRDPELCVLLSDEGIIPKPYYPPSTFFSSVGRKKQHYPAEFELLGVFPNPCRRDATVRYELARPSRVQLALFNELGQQICLLTNGVQPPGRHSVALGLEGFPSGVYYLRLSTGELQQIRKIIHLR